MKVYENFRRRDNRDQKKSYLKVQDYCVIE